MATVAIEAWAGTLPSIEPPTWTAQLQADGGEIWDEFYRAELRGCCDQADLLTFFSLKSGGPTFHSSRSWIPPGDNLPVLEVPNSSLRRFLAFHDRFAATPPEEAKADPDLVGVLQYGPADGPASRFLLRRKGGPGTDYRLHQLAFIVGDPLSEATVVQLWHADGSETPAALTGFQIGIWLVFLGDGPNPAINIPVRGDSLDLGNATLPDGFVLERR